MKLVGEKSLESTYTRSRRAQSQRASLWNSLERGDVVSLNLHGLEYYSGAVDDLTADGRTVWVIDRIGDRRLFHIDDDYELLLLSKADSVPELTAPLP